MFRTHLLILILIIAAVLRLIALNNFPAGLNADEASIGYNAYSLLQTGKDEYGTNWPLTFKSFGDYKPGLYFYIVMPSIALFGLNEWSVRLPSAILGVITVYLIYLLTKEIFKNEQIALISSLMLAISPWHLHFSRGGWETNIATFFITLGMLFFLKGLVVTNYLILSLISFVLSMYTYQSPRLIIPILGLTLILLYKDQIVPNLKRLLKFTPIVLLLVPLILQFTGGTGSARYSGLSFLSDSGPISRLQELRGEHDDLKSFQAKLLHNKITTYIPQFIGHYLDHFNPSFLFINGDPLIRNKVPETGQIYLIFAPFLIIGLISLIGTKMEHSKLLITWILIAPIASSMTYQTPHALRALNMVIPLTIVAGFGLYTFFNQLKRIKVLIVGIVSLILIFEFIHYLDSYYIHYPKRYPVAWEYGFREMVYRLNKIEHKYNKIVITDRYDQPYILVLFYKKYDPKKFQSQAVLSERDKFNFGTVRSFDKYQFRSIGKEEVGVSENTLFIGTGKEIPEGAKIIDKINFPNGEEAFVFFERNS